MKKYIKPLLAGAVSATVARILGYDLFDFQFYLILVVQIVSLKIGYEIGKSN